MLPEGVAGQTPHESGYSSSKPWLVRIDTRVASELAASLLDHS
ncbi:MAG: hypothetical protein QOG83_2519 [Alphaproteobacteria bacterium]|nr:hypothetical protein [Alphaproteobacteria bacterium]